MNIISYLKDKILLFLLHISCMMVLSVFLLATGYQRDLCLLILCCWFLILMIWTTYEYRKRKRYFSRMEAVLCQVDKRFLLGELMPHSARLEDRIYREMIRRSNGSVIEKIHAAEEAKRDYREYMESLVHEIKAPITSISLMCENHKNDFIYEVSDENPCEPMGVIIRNISQENMKIENFVDRALYYARSDEVYKDYFIQETDLEEVAAEVVGRNKYYFIQNGMQVEIDCKDHAFTDKKWIGFILNQILQNSMKYKKEVNAKIRIYTEKRAKGVQMVVEDNGIGIKQAELSRIFEKNFTGTNGREKERATGMGLYLCEKLSTKLGIGIHAESEEGDFTRIILEFPVSAYLSKL